MLHQLTLLALLMDQSIVSIYSPNYRFIEVHQQFPPQLANQRIDEDSLLSNYQVSCFQVYLIFIEKR
jgi:hypothetical protein